MTFDDWKYGEWRPSVEALSILMGFLTLVGVMLFNVLIVPLAESYGEMQNAVERDRRVQLSIQAGIDAKALLHTLEREHDIGLMLLSAQSSVLAAAELQRMVQDRILQHGGLVRSLSTSIVEHEQEKLDELLIDVAFEVDELELAGLVQSMEDDHPPILVRALHIQRAARYLDAEPILSLKLIVVGFYSSEVKEDE